MIIIRKAGVSALITTCLFFLPALSYAEGLDTGSTAWMLTATALVLFMTIPGLALFYAGMVRSKNVLSVLMQCFAITCLMTLVWYGWGYSLAFGLTEGNSLQNLFIGNLDKMFLAGLTKESLGGVGTIPESVWITFQMTFFIITPALIVGAFAERMKFSSMLVFMLVWATLVYLPICHMAWAGKGALFFDWGVLDFAGGTVVHINAGIAGLVAALMLGRRKGHPTTAMPPHNLNFTLMGASMLWVGWFGFNAGSAAAANADAGMAMLVTQIATGAAALSWMFAEWTSHGKPSVLGIASGAVAGLVAITPASGSVAPFGALAIGIAAGVGCFFASTAVKRALKYDDSLDVFGVHAIGGIIGALLTGIFGVKAGGGFVDAAMGTQFMTQLSAVLITVAYCAVITAVTLFIIDKVMGLRVSEEQETEGLDLSLHDERGYIL